MSNVFKFESPDAKLCDRIRVILDEFDCFCDEFGSSELARQDNEEMFEIFNPFYMVGLSSSFSSYVKFSDEVPYILVDNNGRTECMYRKAWTCGRKKSAKQAGRKIAKMLHEFASLLERGAITPERYMTPSEIDKVADYLKDNLTEVSDEDL